VAVDRISGVGDHWCVVYRVTAKTLWVSTPQAGPGSGARSARSGEQDEVRLASGRPCGCTIAGP
jgi:hypothetical protein